MRSVVGVIAGLLVGMCVLILFGLFSGHFNPGNALLVLLTGWLTAVLLGTWTATRTGRGYVPGFIAAALLLAAGIVNILTIPHPVWFWAAGVILFLIATAIGTRLGAPILRR